MGYFEIFFWEAYSSKFLTKQSSTNRSQPRFTFVSENTSYNHQLLCPFELKLVTRLLQAFRSLVLDLGENLTINTDSFDQKRRVNNAGFHSNHLQRFGNVKISWFNRRVYSKKLTFLQSTLTKHVKIAFSKNMNFFTFFPYRATYHETFSGLKAHQIQEFKHFKMFCPVLFYFLVYLTTHCWRQNKI